MKIKKNRRTLKKRILRVMSLCTFITIMIFSSIILYIASGMIRVEYGYLSKYFTRSIAQTMNSEYFLKQMDIADLKDFDPSSQKAVEWFKNLDQTIAAMDPVGLDAESTFHAEIHPAIEIGEKRTIRKEGDFFLLTSSRNMIVVEIEINDAQVYSNSIQRKGGLIAFIEGPEMRPKPNALMRSLLNYFETESSWELLDTSGHVIGKVQARINEIYVIGVFFALVGIILVFALICILISKLISRFLTLPVIIPLNKLHEQITAIAYGNFETTMNAQISLKRPLREIESLAGSTNIIMSKMKEYNDLLSQQKSVLEQQNFELEAQNEELEAQKEEIEAQNEELIESKRQIQEAQTLMVQQEQMASVGQLTAAITHEINTPMGAIFSNVQLGSLHIAALIENEQIKSNEELSDLISQMKEANDISRMACERINEIIRSLKNFSRLDQAEYQETDINEGIRSVLVLTSNLWKRKITLHEDYATLPRIRCYSGLLNQVVMNIIVNAIQSITDNGNIYIKTRRDDENVYIHIRDNGGGIKAEDLEKIFEPGFTTKEAGTGMGMGLSICRNIINKHNGDISVQSEVGVGTEFVVKIPCQLKIEN